MKVAIKALNPEHGKEIIKYLESIGGRNDYRREGNAINQYYFIHERGHITNNPTLPENCTLIELPNNNMTYKPFAITGSQPLLKAMEETLVKEGFKSSKDYSFIKGTSYTKLVSNNKNPKTKEEFLELCAIERNSNNKTFNLPEQWNEALDFILGQLKPKIEVGSWVVCIEKPTEHFPVDIGEIKKVERGSQLQLDNGFCIKGVGDFTHCFRLATPEEIEAAQTVKIGNYQAEKVGNTIKFGCQSFTKEELEAYKKLLNDNINAKIEISGTIITKDILNKLINKL